MSTLLEQIHELSSEEKFALLDTLWLELEAEPFVLTQGQKEELDRRLADYQRNPHDVVSWEEVKAGLALL